MASPIPSVADSLATPNRPSVSRRIAKNLHWVLGGVIALIVSIVVMKSAVQEQATQEDAAKQKAQVTQVATANIEAQPKQEDFDNAIAAGASGPSAGQDTVPDGLRPDSVPNVTRTAGGSGLDAPSHVAVIQNPISTDASAAASAMGKAAPLPTGVPGSSAEKYGNPISDGQGTPEQIKAAAVNSQRMEKILTAGIMAQQGSAGEVSSPTNKRNASIGDINTTQSEGPNYGEISKLIGSVLPKTPVPTDASQPLSANEAWVEKATKKDGSLGSKTISADGVINEITLAQGAIIPAVLLTSVNSDLPGQMSAQTTMDVYDSLTGRNLLIPKGSKLIGAYNSDVKVGQERVMGAFFRMIRPDGKSISLGGMGAADPDGRSGLSGNVNNHFAKMFASSFFIAVFTKYLLGDNDTVTSGNGGQAVGSAAGQTLVDVSSTILNRNKAIQPTVEVPSGSRFVITVSQDMTLPAYRAR